ncbi:hypothetical protein [Microbulbifer sp. TRSA005]|uniref:hypothetical protein n=1 Tax=unclassified Microbulbifer TaxID=2619833 RepID=UPI00403928D7
MLPNHHKEIAVFLKERLQGSASVTAFRDNHGSRPIPIGQFGGSFFSTIGAFDMQLKLPNGNFELAASGTPEWLPNAVASSIYWLTGRECSEWPLVCEDVVRDNTRSTYRHMAYVPSIFGLTVSSGQTIQWLLGVPLVDRDIGITASQVLERAQKLYPDWLFSAGA